MFPLLWVDSSTIKLLGCSPDLRGTIFCFHLQVRTVQHQIGTIHTDFTVTPMCKSRIWCWWNCVHWFHNQRFHDRADDSLTFVNVTVSVFILIISHLSGNAKQYKMASLSSPLSSHSNGDVSGQVLLRHFAWGEKSERSHTQSLHTFLANLLALFFRFSHKGSFPLSGWEGRVFCASVAKRNRLE